ncbi:ShK toxin domain [Fragilaria crotonensis]|nr:ShK toxin domain [Fragilaria crotonensis]
MKTSWMTTLVLVLMHSIEPAANSCVAKGKDRYVCMTDSTVEPSGMNEKTGFLDASDSLPDSVIQRRDGSDAEKAAVNVVLQKMNEYLIHEVYPIKDYKQNLPRCRNSDELCAFWASVNECETNRIFMLSNCAAACRFCLLANTDIQ